MSELLPDQKRASTRSDQLRRWVGDTVNLHEKKGATIKWTKVAGDASFRSYYRFSGHNKDIDFSYIVMDALPEKESIETFVSIAKRMYRDKVRVPEIVAENREQGFLLLEDFGNTMLKSLLHVESGDQLFNRILPVLASLKKCSAYDLPRFDEYLYKKELARVPDWYLKHHRGVEITDKENELWLKLCDLLINEALSQPQIFVHRDFHSCNLMLLENDEIGVIDFQDAVEGPITYDLISWLWDRYITWNREDMERWMLLAKAQLAENVSDNVWIKYCDYMGLQRNLKIVGIFARLYYRDGKQGYLEMIPQFIHYIYDVVYRYPELVFCVNMLDSWLKPDNKVSPKELEE